MKQLDHNPWQSAKNRVGTLVSLHILFIETFPRFREKFQNYELYFRLDETHSNGVITVGLANEDCVNSDSPLTTPLIAFQGKNKDTPVPQDLLA